MNKSLKQMKMLIVAVAVAFAPIYASEVAPVEVVVIEEETTENSSVWYNKDYVKAAVAVAATVAAVYTIAVHKNKIASSFAALTAFVASRSTEVKNTVEEKETNVTEEKTDITVEVAPQVTEQKVESLVVNDEQDHSITSNVKNGLVSAWERVSAITLPKLEINENTYQSAVDRFNLTIN